MKTTCGDDNNQPISGTPYQIVKLIGITPHQLAMLHDTLEHPEWRKEERQFVNPHNKADAYDCFITQPTILEAKWNKEHRSYVVEINVPFFVQERNHGYNKLYKSQEMHLLPRSVMESIYDAIGVFPTAEAVVQPKCSHGPLKITAPF